MWEISDPYKNLSFKQIIRFNKLFKYLKEDGIKFDEYDNNNLKYFVNKEAKLRFLEYKEEEQEKIFASLIDAKFKEIKILEYGREEKKKRKLEEKEKIKWKKYWLKKQKEGEKKEKKRLIFFPEDPHREIKMKIISAFNWISFYLFLISIFLILSNFCLFKYCDEIISRIASISSISLLTLVSIFQISNMCLIFFKPRYDKKI